MERRLNRSTQDAHCPWKHSAGTVSSLLLDQEDWSFAHLTPAHTLWGPHGYHRYPAKFIPQLVRRVIERYSTQGDLVGDLFLGSATTGIEALRAGRYFYGSDIHPVALLISQAKCTPIDPAILLVAWEELDSQLNNVPQVSRRVLTAEEETYARAIDIAHATTDDRFAYWFPTAHREALRHILHYICAMLEEQIRTFFLCAFSNILRNCSIWLSGSTKPQKDFQKKLGDPVEEFRKQVQSMLKRNRLYWEDLQRVVFQPQEIVGRSTIVSADVRALPLPNEALDLLVTSPPYATCYEYSEMHQLTQLWFEKYGIFSEHCSDYSYIGTKGISRRVASMQTVVQSTGSASADEALQQLQNLAGGIITSKIRHEVRALHYYFQDMKAALLECARVVVRGKRLVLIIGDSYRRGITIPTSDALCEMAVTVGLELEQKIVRRIPGRVLVSIRDKKTGRFSTKAQSDTQVYPEENVLIFKKYT
jgi:hypothetical protein